MRINSRLDLSIYILFSTLIGILFGTILISKGYAKPKFFDCTFEQLLRLLVIIIMGGYVAYRTSVKVNIEQKKKELALELIKEAQNLFNKQLELIQSCIENNNGGEKGKLVLSGFKKMSNKLATVKLICEKVNSQLSIASIENDFKLIKELFGDKYYSGGFSDDDKSQLVKTFDKFEKRFDDLRTRIII